MRVCVYVRLILCMCVCVCVRARMRACVRARARASVLVCVSSAASFGIERQSKNTFLPLLLTEEIYKEWQGHFYRPYAGMSASRAADGDRSP